MNSRTTIHGWHGQTIVATYEGRTYEDSRDLHNGFLHWRSCPW
jgi:hypothetical protein